MSKHSDKEDGDDISDGVDEMKKKLNWTEMNKLDDVIDDELKEFMTNLSVSEVVKTKQRLFAFLKLIIRYVNVVKSRSLKSPSVNLNVYECTAEDKYELFQNVGEQDYLMNQLQIILNDKIFDIDMIWKGFIIIFKMYTQQLTDNSIRLPMFKLHVIESNSNDPPKLRLNKTIVNPPPSPSKSNTFSGVVSGKPIKNSKIDMEVYKELQLYRSLILSDASKTSLIEKLITIDKKYIDIKYQSGEEFLIAPTEEDDIILRIYKKVEYTDLELKQIDRLKFVLYGIKTQKDKITG